MELHSADTSAPSSRPTRSTSGGNPTYPPLTPVPHAQGSSLPRAPDSSLLTPAAERVNQNNQNSTTATRNKAPLKRVACKVCRQAKLKCEGLDNSVRSCKRCKRLVLSCQVDTSYKRVSKRLKIDELAEELETLRSVVKQTVVGNPVQEKAHAVPLSPHEQNRAPDLSASHTSTTREFMPEVNDQGQLPDRFDRRERFQIGQEWQPPMPSPGSFGTSFGSYANASEPRSLEHIELEGTQVNDLFQSFFKYYHHFLQILDPTISPDMYYSRSPPLFWAILSVGARRYEEDTTLLGSLKSLVSKLVWNSALQVPLSSHIIQAMLLLVAWPFPCDSKSKDPSLLFVATAKSAAMQHGLHRPEIVQDFRRVTTRLTPEEIQDAVKLWVGCYITAEYATTSAGQPSLFSEDYTIDQACDDSNRYIVPDNLRYHLLIQKYLGRVNLTMASNNRAPNSCPGGPAADGLLRLLESELDDLELRIENKITDIHRIALTMARLQLRTYYFFEVSFSKDRKEGLLKAYTTALSLIARVTEADTETDLIKYAPAIFGEMLITAGMLVIKIINSSYARYIDIEGGKRSFNLVINLLRRSVIEDNDLQGRASKIMTQLWSIHRSRKARREQEPSLTVKSRLSASVLHDELWTWREELGGQGSPLKAPHAPSPHPTTISSTTNPEETWSVIENPQQLPQQFNPSYPQSRDNIYMSDLAEEISSLDWTWDMGCQSLLPVDVDSYQMMPQMYFNAENLLR